jgi:hypothetical protein
MTIEIFDIDDSDDSLTFNIDSGDKGVFIKVSQKGKEDNIVTVPLLELKAAVLAIEPLIRN